MSKNPLSFRSSRIPYYGPHPCDNCGVSIVKMAQEFGGNAFTAPEGPIYPNTEWHVHICDPHNVYVRKGKDARKFVRNHVAPSLEGSPSEWLPVIAAGGCPSAVRIHLGWIIIKGNGSNPKKSPVLSAHQTYATDEWGAWCSAQERIENNWPIWDFPENYKVLERKQ